MALSMRTKRRPKAHVPVKAQSRRYDREKEIQDNAHSLTGKLEFRGEFATGSILFL